MKSVLSLVEKFLFFIAFSLLIFIFIPYELLVRSWLAQVISLNTAVKITAIFGGYPEPYDFIYMLICLAINTILAIIASCIFIRIIHFSKRALKKN